MRLGEQACGERGFMGLIQVKVRFSKIACSHGGDRSKPDRPKTEA
jgi:hypothetical protein